MVGYWDCAIHARISALISASQSHFAFYSLSLSIPDSERAGTVWCGRVSYEDVGIYCNYKNSNEIALFYHLVWTKFNLISAVAIQFASRFIQKKKKTLKSVQIKSVHILSRIRQLWTLDRISFDVHKLDPLYN